MARVVVCVAALLLAACTSTGNVRERAGLPLASGALKKLQSENSAVTGGLLWTETVKEGAPCVIYEGWVRITIDAGNVWIPRDVISYIELRAPAD